MSVVIRVPVFAALWWLMVQGRTDAWLIGLPAIVLAAVVASRLGEATLPRLSVPGLIAFLALFLRDSLLGGIDVARRTLGRRLRVAPGFRRFPLRLHDRRARVLLINCIGLLPGTLAADVHGDTAELHLLDIGDDPEPQLRELEGAIARMFRVPLEDSDD